MFSFVFLVFLLPSVALLPTIILAAHQATSRFTPISTSLGDNPAPPFPEFHNLLESCQYSTIESFNQNPCSPSQLLVLHVNIRSISKNYDALQSLVLNLKPKPQVILASETWLEHSLSQSYTIEGYRLETSQQPDSRGKGAAIYITNSLCYSRRSDLESNMNRYQTIFIDFKASNKSIILGTAYRSPSFPVTEFISYFESVLEKIQSEQKFCIIGGDFNIDILKQNTDDACSNFINSLAASGFLPCISLPTRVTSHSSTLIDNFFCNDPSFVESSNVLLEDISDHLPITVHVNLNINVLKKLPTKHLSFDFRNIEPLRTNLSTKLAGFSEISDAETASSILINTLSCEITRLSIKKVSRRTVPIQPWISYGLLRCINRKNYLHKKFIHSPNEHNNTIFKNYRNALNKLIRTAKVKYFQHKLHQVKSDSKKLWELLLTIIRKKKPAGDLPTHFKVDGMNISEPKLISEQFNNFFCSIAPKLDAAIPSSTSDPLSYIHNIAPSELFNFQPTSPAAIEHIIYALNNCGAGVDGVSTKILKMVAPILIPHLTHMFNLCLSQGVFPSNLKRAIVVPIFKNGDPFSFNNYRPISLLPIISKILEKIVYSQLSSFLSSEGFLYEYQFGFRSNHSTYMPISLLYDNVTMALKSKNVCAALYLDLSKAFDTVNPSILLNKLKAYGIRHKSLDFFHSYLSGRSQVIKYNSLTSTSPKYIKLGVPQGSILGPLLFLVYINDIQNSSLSPKFILFADDTALLYTAPSLNELQTTINSSLPNIATWLNSNRLTLNTKKSTYQLFSLSSPLPDLRIHINGTPLCRSKSTKYLGVIIDEDLKWSSHINQVESTISRNIGLIRRSQHMLDSRCLLLLYNALVLPYLNYCLQIWGSSYVSKFSRLITLQKKIIRIIDHAYYLEHTSPIFKKYQILKFPDLVKASHINVMHNYLARTLPPIISDNFSLCQHNTQRAVRTPQHFDVPFAPTNYRKFSLYIAAPDAWNKIISPRIPNLNDIPMSKTFFKKVLKKIFVDSY